MAAETLIDYNCQYVKIYSDSQAALLALNSNEFTSQVVVDTARKLNNLALQAKKVTLVWIKAHVGHRGNEEADTFAKEATTYELIQQFGMPQSELNNLIRKDTDDIWQDEWKEYPHARMTKEL